jgi:hypothetical protein
LGCGAGMQRALPDHLRFVILVAAKMKRIAPVFALLWLAGCASYHVQRGALIGSLAGAALGATAGELISDPNVVGSRNSARRGDTSLPQGETILISTGVGLVIGGIVGAMWGHRRDDGYEGKPPPPPPPSEASIGASEVAVSADQLPAHLTKL